MAGSAASMTLIPAANRAMICLPRAPRPRGTGVRGQRMLEPAREEHRAPAPPVVAPELEVILLAGHPCHDVPDPAPRVEPAMEQPKLGLVRRHEGEAYGGTEHAAARVSHAEAVVRRRSIPSREQRHVDDRVVRQHPPLED